MESYKYKLELNETQLRVVAAALDFYSRFLSGQWRIPDELEHNEYINQGKQSDFWNKRNFCQNMLNDNAAYFMNLHKNESLGIGNKKLHENGKVAYDIYRPIYEEFSKGDGSVYSSEGFSYSKQGRIKKIEKI